jgi:hypothetical protein
VDSLHEAEHVKKEIYGYFPYLNKNAVIFFDDVDSGPYMINQRKDSVVTEIANRKIFNLLEAIFMANLSSIEFSVMRGSTGLARFDKISSLGEQLAQPVRLNARNSKWFWTILSLMHLRKRYEHNNSDSSSFLIDPVEHQEK